MIVQPVTSYFIYFSLIFIEKLDVLYLNHLLLCIMTEVCISFNILFVIYFTEVLEFTYILTAFIHWGIRVGLIYLNN